MDDIQGKMQSIPFRDGLKAKTFVADNGEKTAGLLNEWLSGSKDTGDIHYVGVIHGKLGKNIFVVTAVHSDA